MKHYGSLDIDTAITLKGKPHGIEQVDTLGAWTSSDIGRIVFETSTSKIWTGRNAGWEEITEGHVGAHTHDDRYYTEAEVNAFFEGYSSGKATISWANVTNHPLEYAPSVHGSSAHSVAYIVASDVNFTNLSANGAVGTGATQVAYGNHNHDGSYATAAHLHTGIYEPAISTKLSAFNVDFGTTHTTAAYGDHDHATVYAAIGHLHADTYEPVIATKLSAFNVDFGTTHTTVAYGDHEHAGVYEPAISTKLSAFNVDFGTTHTTAAYGDHDHAGVYEPAISTKLSAFNVDFGTTHTTAAYGDHNHDSAYAPIISEVSALPTDTPAIGTVRVNSDGSALYIYTTAGWKTASLA